jgi:coatomer subunit beta'
MLLPHSCYLFILCQVNPKAAESLADPAEYPNLFEDWQVALNVEQSIASQR